MFLDIWDCYKHDGETFWNRKLRGWEVDEVRELDFILKSVKLNGKKDELIWNPSKAPFTTNLVEWLENGCQQDKVSWCFFYGNLRYHQVFKSYYGSYIGQ